MRIWGFVDQRGNHEPKKRKKRYPSNLSEGSRLLLGHLPGGCKKLRKIWVDGGYRGQLVKWVAARFRFVLEVVLRPKETRKFVLLPRRWVVERTFGWLNHSRRLSKCYERQTRTDEIWMYIAMTRIMLNRLA